MFFSDLQNSLLDSLRGRVRNGELTERSLARLVGVSQPHIHNVLKGQRLMSSILGDQILQHLRISILDLIDRDSLSGYLDSEVGTDTQYSYLPVLEGRLGPGQPWPESIDGFERFPLSRSRITDMRHPVVTRLAEDARMRPLFGAGDLLLLDQSHKRRVQIDPDAYYVVKRGSCGLVRRLRLVGSVLYLIPEDSARSSAGWERISLENMQIQHLVRAKATLLARDVEWSPECRS